jgi:hypothetical protein
MQHVGRKAYVHGLPALATVPNPAAAKIGAGGGRSIIMTRSLHATGLLFLLIIGLGTGCSSQGERMVQSFADTRDALVESRSQVDATLGSLTRMRITQGEPLKDVFGQYKDQVSKLGDQAQKAKWQAQTMRDEQEQHIKAWQKEMESIKDPTIQASLESRRKAARSNFKLVQMYADDIRTRYEPFVQGNKNIVQALSIDLSPATISSLGQSIDKVMADGTALKERMGAMQQALNNIANGVSPLGQ